jgi:hypothetical protein
MPANVEKRSTAMTSKPKGSPQVLEAKTKRDLKLRYVQIASPKQNETQG